jgi:hypothetical protein
MKRGREEDVALIQEIPRAPRDYCTMEDEEASVALIQAILRAEEGQRAKNEEAERRSLAMVQQLQAEQFGEQEATNRALSSRTPPGEIPEASRECYKAEKEEDPSLALAQRYFSLPLRLLTISPKLS